MPYQLPAPSTLDDIFKMNPAAFSQAQEFMQGGVQQNEADLRKAQLANMFDEQNDPLRVQHQRGLNNAQDAMLPGLFADSSMKQRKNTNEAALNDDVMKQAKMKFIAEASDYDIKMLENEAQKMMYSLDPKVRAQGLNIAAMHKDIVSAREKDFSKTEAKLREIQETGAQARLTQAEGIAGGRYAKGGSGGSVKDIDSAAATGKLTFEKAAVAMRFKADATEDEDLKQFYSERANQYEIAAQKQRQAAGQGVAKPDLPGMGIPAVGGQPPGPSFNNPPTKTNAEAQIKAAVEAVGQQYDPNKYDYRINPETGKVQRKPKG